MARNYIFLSFQTRKKLVFMRQKVVILPTVLGLLNNNVSYYMLVACIMDFELMTSICRTYFSMHQACSLLMTNKL